MVLNVVFLKSSTIGPNVTQKRASLSQLAFWGCLGPGGGGGGAESDRGP